MARVFSPLLFLVVGNVLAADWFLAVDGLQEEGHQLNY